MDRFTSPKAMRILLALIAIALVVVSATVPGAAKFTAFLWR